MEYYHSSDFKLAYLPHTMVCIPFRMIEKLDQYLGIENFLFFPFLSVFCHSKKASLIFWGLVVFVFLVTNLFYVSTFFVHLIKTHWKTIITLNSNLDEVHKRQEKIKESQDFETFQSQPLTRIRTWCQLFIFKNSFCVTGLVRKTKTVN